MLRRRDSTPVKRCNPARERVDECLRSWQSDGIIVIEEGLITVINRKSLEELAVQKSGLSAVGILASLSE